MIHDDFGPEDERGFTWVDELEDRNGVIDRIRAFERAARRGAYPETIDHNAAYWAAEGVTSPGERESTNIYRFGLRALEHDVLTVEAFREQWQQLDRWRVSNNALLVLTLFPDIEDRTAPCWTSAHPVVLAIRSGVVDGALTTGSLAHGTVALALTNRTVKHLTNYPALMSRMHCAWSAVRVAGGQVTSLEHETPVADPTDLLYYVPYAFAQAREALNLIELEESLESQRLEGDLEDHLAFETIRQQFEESR